MTLGILNLTTEEVFYDNFFIDIVLQMFTTFYKINLLNEKNCEIQVFDHLNELIYKHVKFYKKSSKLHVVIYTCNKRDIVGIKWPISLGNSHRTFSQFVIYTDPPKDLISIKILHISMGNKVQQKNIL